MAYQNDSLFEWFEVSFGKKSSIVAGKEYPLGYFAAEALEIDDALLAELKDLTQVANEEFNVFLNARTASSAGMAVQELDRAWALSSSSRCITKSRTGMENAALSAP